MDLSALLFALRCPRPLCSVVAVNRYTRAHDAQPFGRNWSLPGDRVAPAPSEPWRARGLRLDERRRARRCDYWAPRRGCLGRAGAHGRIVGLAPRTRAPAAFAFGGCAYSRGPRNG